ncbi:hypothetical protein HYH03_009735 [Edaphochlamys debaryana]|uniref:AB hydrolase-1 domain-containing protein n=1 Tax=Edaphochlamys debaryana TaxID=47281 RepID=A0A835Y3T1_9CHLO|nr:hypothetical protein HYH03_009735 [Edaphochlamys debaryana]|eukprot:KAG2492005.1 hypothetical protein HYH03_009735 [Edaphochlamys debaryana]
MAASSDAAVWTRYVDVGGVRSELWGLDASTSGPPALQVVVVPGNPGTAAFFRPFMSRLHAALGGRARVLALSQAGHDGGHHHEGRVWSLAEQVAHKVAFLRGHVLGPGRPPAVLVGHSIGAYMALKAVAHVEGLAGAEPHHTEEQASPPTDPAAEREPILSAAGDKGIGPGASVSGVAAVEAFAVGGPGEAAPAPGSSGGAARVVKVVAVFPFLEANTGGNWRQRALSALAEWHQELGWAVGALASLLPSSLLAGCIRLTGAADAETAALVASRLGRTTVHNALYLASTEFRDLTQPWDWAVTAALGPRLHVMGCEADTWLSREQWEDMCQRLPGLQATWHPDLRHDFCTCPRQSAAAADHIADLLRPCMEPAAERAAHAAPGLAPAGCATTGGEGGGGTVLRSRI